MSSIVAWTVWIFLALVLAGIIYQSAGARADAARIPPPGRLIDVGRGRLHVHEQGSGRPVVIFEAGISASSLSWGRVAPQVAGFAKACCYDRSGLAWSDRTHAPVSARSLAAELDVLLSAAAIDTPVVIVAHSFGTFVARAFAHDFRQKTAGIVLVDPIYPAEFLKMSAAERRRLQGGVFLSRVGAALASVGVVRWCLNRLLSGSTGAPRRISRFFGSEAASLMSRLVRQVQKLPQESWPAMRAHWSRPKSFLAMADHLSSLPRSAAEIEATGPLGDLPLVVITAGSQPPVVRAEHARIAALSTRGSHVIAEGAGHWILIDQPEIVVKAIQELGNWGTGN